MKKQKEPKRTKKAHKFNSDIDLSVKVFELGASYWEKFYNDLEKNRLLSGGDRDYISSIIKYVKRGSLLSGAQCKKLLKIIEKAYIVTSRVV